MDRMVIACLPEAPFDSLRSWSRMPGKKNVLFIIIFEVASWALPWFAVTTIILGYEKGQNNITSLDEIVLIRALISSFAVTYLAPLLFHLAIGSEIIDFFITEMGRKFGNWVLFSFGVRTPIFILSFT